jgi:dephospho-CoA kinase
VIIGLTGRNASGKGTVAEYFLARGFQYQSLSDAIRVHLRSQGLEPTRDHMIAAGRSLRAEGGPGILAVRTLERIPAGTDAVVDSIRNPAEVEALRQRPDFVLLEVTADRHVRYARLSERARAGDATSYEEFVRQEEAELHSGDASAQQLNATAAMADVAVQNDGDVEALHAELDALIDRLRAVLAAGRFPRPGSAFDVG